MTKELIMSLYRTNVHIKIFNGMICIHLYISEFMRENKVLLVMMAILMSNIHLREDGSSQHDDPANSFKIHQWENISDNEKKVGNGSQCLSTKWTAFISAVTPFWFQNTMQLTSHVIKKVKGSSPWSYHQVRQRKHTSFFVEGGKRCNNLCKDYFSSIYAW